MRFRSAATIAIVAATAACAACGGSGTSSGNTTTSTTTPSGAKQTFCTDVSNFQTSANSLKKLDPSNTTLSQLKTSATNLLNDGKAVVSSGKNLAGVNADELQSSLRSLQSAVKSVPSSGSVKAGLQEVQTAASSTSETFTSMAKNAGCKTSSY